MSWSMPTSGQWNPGALAGQVAPMATAMTPAMPQDMGNYTPEQWTMMQQQNWQQWAQWQQQYAQWQTQYGDKYAMQMQAVQQMGGAPMPAQAPPPAPPPPAHPPPPPHENDAPLYSAPPPPAPAHASNNADLGNNSWSGPSRKDAANAEALKKLAEEERLFDIQFKKWEEEIDKWKRDNVNHPDKQAYKEYEDKFEACRAQLMERRQQMNQRRAKLTGVPQGNAAASGSSAATVTTGNNVQVPITANSTVNQVPSNTHSQPPTYYNKKEDTQQNYYNQYQGYPNQGHPNQGHPNQGHPNQGHPNQGHPNQGHSNQGHPNQGHPNQGHPNQGHPNQGHPNQGHPKHGQSHQQQKSYKDSGYGGNNNAGYSNQGRSQQQPQKQQQQAPEPSSRYGDGNIKSFEAQERYDNYEDNSYQEDNHNYKNNFLTASGSNKGIPGLDLVPEEKKAQPEVIDITEDQPKAPDYTTISKGINNILGDEKIMNILNMVRGSTNKPNAQMQDNSNSPNPWNNQQNNQNMPYNRQDMNQQKQGQQMNQQQNYSNNQGQHPPRMFNDRQGHQGQYNDNHSNSPYEQGYDDQNYQNNRGMNNMPMRPNMPAGRLLPGPNNMQNSNNFPQQNRNMQMGQDNNMMPSMSQPPPPPPPKPQWVEEPMFTPQLVVDYEHKPLRLKARDFIEPVHTFDYNHQSTDEYRKKDFDGDDEELFSRKPRRLEDDDMYARRGGPDRFGRERDPLREYQERYRDKDPPREFDRRPPRDDMRDDFRPRYPPREDDRRRPDERFEPGRRDDRIEPGRRDDRTEPGRRDDRTEPGRRDDRTEPGRRDDRTEPGRRDDRTEPGRRDDRDRHGNKRELLYRRDEERDRQRPERRDDRNRSNERTKDNEGRRRAHSIESDHSNHSSAKKAKETKTSNAESKHVVMIDDLLEMPGREMRPEKIVVILRGPPGSGKSYLAKLIRDKEAEFSSTARIMSIDDYFVQEVEIQEKDPESGKMVKKSSMKYEYEEKLEETYLNSLKRAFKRSLTDGYFPFLIYDACNDQLKSYADVWNFARQNGFQVYICTMELDAATCHKRNIHSRTLEDIQIIVARWFPTPAHHIQLDATSLLQSAAIQDVEMEDADDVIIMEDDEVEVIEHTSKWEKMDDVNQLARLDGTSKPLRPSQLSMADYLQLDEWQPAQCKPGKKTVRWADIEEGRQQEKMRAIGFVVGQTDWNRMTDPSKGSSALTQTKYIERVRRNDY